MVKNLIFLMTLLTFAQAENIAIIIANYDYDDQTIQRLITPDKDTEVLSSILEQKYDFFVRREKNLKKDSILGVLDDAITQAKSYQSILIYYAGHGKEGYWIPVDGKKNNELTFIENKLILEKIEEMSKRYKHTLLISDSCFSGSFLPKKRNIINNSKEYISKKMQQKSCQIITSGSLEDVEDSYADGHSPFAYFLIKKLREEKEIMSASQLGIYLENQITDQKIKQTPNHGAIYYPENDAGEFFFIPKGKMIDEHGTPSYEEYFMQSYVKYLEGGPKGKMIDEPDEDNKSHSQNRNIPQETTPYEEYFMQLYVKYLEGGYFPINIYVNELDKNKIFNLCLESQSDKNALALLGFFYAHGIFVDRDYKKAKKIYDHCIDDYIDSDSGCIFASCLQVYSEISQNPDNKNLIKMLLKNIQNKDYPLAFLMLALYSKNDDEIINSCQQIGNHRVFRKISRFVMANTKMKIGKTDDALKIYVDLALKDKYPLAVSRLASLFQKAYLATKNNKNIDDVSKKIFAIVQEDISMLRSILCSLLEVQLFDLKRQIEYLENKSVHAYFLQGFFLKRKRLEKQIDDLSSGW